MNQDRTAVTVRPREKSEGIITENVTGIGGFCDEMKNTARRAAPMTSTGDECKKRGRRPQSIRTRNGWNRREY